jgi:hypothetical protein
MADWETRTRPQITLISPKKSTFNAKWRGDVRTISKKIGIFNFPKFNGSVTQDLGVDGTGYPLTFFFDGANADKEQQRFESVTSERGRWTVIHPTKGKLDLQPISFEINDNPVESGGVYQISSEWIESVDLFSLLSAPQLQALSKAQGIATNAASVSGMISNVSQISVAAISAVSSTINGALAIVTDPLSALAAGSADITGAIDSTVRSIQTQLTSSVLDLTQLSGSIQTLVQLPTQISADFESRIETYKSMTSDLFDLTPDNVENILSGTFTTGVTIEDKNAIATQEMILSAMIVAFAQIAVSSEYKTRVQALTAAEDISEQFVNITNELDRSQEAFKNEDIDKQYFSQSQTFIDSAKLTYQGVAFAIGATFNLPVEKKVVIQNPISAFRFSIEQYGEEDIDENYQLSIDSNKLKGNEILMLPRDREMVVYV